MIDWGLIKREYVTDATSTYRSLASKYGLSFKQIGQVAKAEDWVGQRKQHQDELYTKAMEKSVEEAVDGITQCIQVAQKLLKRIAMRVDDTDTPIGTSEYRQISGAIKDIKDIMTSGETADNTIQIIMGDAEEFINGNG